MQCTGNRTGGSNPPNSANLFMKKYSRKTNCNCIICSKAIYRRPFQLKKGKVYCSQQCYVQASIIWKSCPVCNSKFKSGLNKKHCSKACANKLKIGSKYKTGPRKDKVTTQRFLKSRLVALRGEFCERCSYSNQKILNIHHKIRRKDGGSDDLDNLELLCPNCHAEEHYGK